MGGGGRQQRIPITAAASEADGWSLLFPVFSCCKSGSKVTTSPHRPTPPGGTNLLSQRVPPVRACLWHLGRLRVIGSFRAPRPRWTKVGRKSPASPTSFGSCRSLWMAFPWNLESGARTHRHTQTHTRVENIRWEATSGIPSEKCFRPQTDGNSRRDRTGASVRSPMTSPPGVM